WHRPASPQPSPQPLQTVTSTISPHLSFISDALSLPKETPADFWEGSGSAVCVGGVFDGANDPELVNKRIHNTHDERPQPSVKDRMGLFFLRALLALPPWHTAMLGGFVLSFSLF